jgi:hypothetical protein
VNTPFFIVGAQRSGTTLLRLMLAAHPRIAIPPESHFIPDLLRIERRLGGGLAGIREDVARMLVTHDRLVDFELGPAFIRETVQRLWPLTTRGITEALFAEYARRQGKPRWGDKTPRHCNFLPELGALFPEARFIHVVRDGRDTAMSSVKAAFGPKSFTPAAYLWRDSVRAARRGARALEPDRWMELRYEDLLAEPAAALERACAFLGEEFHEDMLRYAERAEGLVASWERSWHAKLAGPIDGTNAGKWRRELSVEQIALVQRIGTRELRAYGYPLEPVPASPALHARVLAQCARHHACRLASRVRQAMRRSDPAMRPTAFRPN